MLNLTNWWCGYRPGRVYNAYVYAGGGLYWTLTKYAEKPGEKEKWHNCHDRVITIRAGLTQEFNLTKHFALGLDLRATAISNHSDSWGKTQVIGEALLTATYKFNKTDWSAPVVPVCPPAENCDEYRARLAASTVPSRRLSRKFPKLPWPPSTTPATSTPLLPLTARFSNLLPA